MSQCKKSRELFDAAYLNELNKEQKHFLETHLRDCAKCRSEFDETTFMLNIMSKKNRVEPEPAFWDGYWARLKERMEKEEVLHPKIEKRWKMKTLFPSMKISLRWNLFSTHAWQHGPWYPTPVSPSPDPGRHHGSFA